MTNRRYSLSEHLTITRILGSLSSLQSLAGSISKAIKADYSQLSAISRASLPDIL